MSNLGPLYLFSLPLNILENLRPRALYISPTHPLFSQLTVTDEFVPQEPPSDPESASGSGSDESTQSEDEFISKLLAQTRKTVLEDIPETEDSTLLPRTPIVWFEAPEEAPGKQFGFPRAAFPTFGAPSQTSNDGFLALNELKTLQLTQEPTQETPRLWTLLMLGGGHFAGMIVSLIPKLVSRGKGKEKARELVVLKRKTFHRYTTRRKQGGAQSANDNSKGKAKSAGAQIRRYNEQMLSEEIQGLLREWSLEIKQSEAVFLRASKANHKIFFGFDNSPLTKKDDRVRGFGFPTRRPTHNELLRSFSELTRPKVTHLTPEELTELDAAYLASIAPPVSTTPAPPPPPKKEKEKAPSLTEEEMRNRDRWERLIDMVKKGRMEAVASFLDKYSESLRINSPEEGLPWGTLPLWMTERKNTPTLLHVASSADQADLIRFFLLDKKADPTVGATMKALEYSLEFDSDNLRVQTPYELAPTRTTRNVFRLLTTSHPDMWDWTGSTLDGARVPSGLTEEQDEQQTAKKSNRRDKLRDKIREREKEKEEKLAAERKEEEKLLERQRLEAQELETRKTSKGPQRLGGGSVRDVGIGRELNGAGLTPEQRMRVEREQRLRAAEARLKNAS